MQRYYKNLKPESAGLFFILKDGGTVELGGGGVVPFGEICGAFYDGVHEAEKCAMLFVDRLHRRGALEAAELYGSEYTA